MENVQLLGSGHLHDRIQNKISVFNSDFKSFSDLEHSITVWVGDKTPPPNAKIVIKKSILLNYHDLLQEIKKMLQNDDNLIAAGFYDVTIQPYFQNLTIMMCRDNVVRTFQNLSDFDNYFVEYLSSL